MGPMKRYRVLRFDWNSTGDMLGLEPTDEWSDESKALHRENHARMIERLTREYGELEIEAKLTNLRDIGGQAFTVVGYHNHFYRQARDAFVMGAYYPALTAVCTLGERILNHLLLELRDHYQLSPEYAELATVKSSSNWRKMIPALESWGVLLPEAATQFRELLELRNRAIHYNPGIAEKQREMAIAAQKHLHRIISIQFGAFGNQPWFIPDAAGVVFIRKGWEDNPFVKLVYIPASVYVGPRHYIEIDDQTGEWTVYDEQYEDREITDEQYLEMYEISSNERVEATRA
jgi:hypothetical protein